MRVENVLHAKGATIHTVDPDERMSAAVHKLKRHHIGALVVSGDGETIDGLLTERMVVEGLDKSGVFLMDQPVRLHMVQRFPKCAPEDSLDSVMEQMTRTRFRHLPVVDGERVCGLVSIGDLVKARLDELQLETKVLRDAYLVKH